MRGGYHVSMALIFLAAVSGGRIQQLRGTLDNIESRLLAEAIQGRPLFRLQIVSPVNHA